MRAMKDSLQFLVAIVTVGISILALAVSAYFANMTLETQRNTIELQRKDVELQNAMVELQKESLHTQRSTLRPSLEYQISELSFDKKLVKIRIQVVNIGGSTAIVSGMDIYTHKSDSLNVWRTIFEGTRLTPGKSRIATFFLDRPTTVDPKGAKSPFVFDPFESINAMGKLPFQARFTNANLPNTPFEDNLVFTSLPWHDKSIIGVR